MTIRSLLLISLIAIFGLLSSCTNGNETTKVMSFNIRYANPNDGINAWSNRHDLVYDFLNEQKPDIIGFQEALKIQVDQLSNELNAYSYVGAGRDDGKDSGEFTPIFYRKDKYDLLSSSHFWLSETPEVVGSKAWGAVLPRIVTWVQLQDKQNGYIFYVFNTHLSHVSAYARNESTILLLNKIKTIAGSAPVVLTGDFNATPEERMYTTMTNNWKGYKQLWDSRAVSFSDDEPFQQTFNGFNAETPTIVIDHIFVNGYFDVERFVTHKVLKDDVFISDHYPISSELSFRLNKREEQGKSLKLKQRVKQPIINIEGLCFYDSVQINIEPQGRNAKIFYTLNSDEPDTTAELYAGPILLKESTTIKAKSFRNNMYPSALVTQSLIRKRKNNAQLVEVIPMADEKYYSKDNKALFDNKNGNIDNLSDGSWVGFNGTDNDFLFDFKRPAKVSELYLSGLSQPAKWIVMPSKIEVKTSNDGIHYTSIATKKLNPSFDETQTTRFIEQLNFKAKARFVKIAVYNGGLLPPKHSGNGNPSWFFIDEMVLQ